MRLVRNAAPLVAVLLVAGCADVPEESLPEVVAPAGQANQNDPVSAPERGLIPINVVRKFIEDSGRPRDSHALARRYLAQGPESQQGPKTNWRPSGDITIIKDSFNTYPAPSDRQPDAEGVRTVLMTGTPVGSLKPDNAFIPANSPDQVEIPIRLRRQQAGEWRITDPPNKIFMTKSSFNEHYYRVPVQFFAKDSTTLVPDLRYVAAEPSDDLPSKVVDLLLDGPSSGLAGAVRNPLGGTISLESDVRIAAGGELVVPLTGVGDKTEQQRRLMVAQLVKSLRPLPISKIQPLVGDTPLIEEQRSWRNSELPVYSGSSALASGLSGLFVYQGRVRGLDDGAPLPSPAGAGVYDVAKAAQSIGGGQLAVVERGGDGPRLRIGSVDGQLQRVDLPANSMTRPTWRPASSADSSSNTVWTVVDGESVARVQRNSEGGWSSQSVDASAITTLGDITTLRLSRDGARVAAVADGHLVIAAVVRESGAVKLSAPRVLQSDTLTDVSDVAWSSQYNVVAATSSTGTPVVRLPIDGLRSESYSTSNLTPPVRAVAAAPGNPVIVAGGGRLSTASDIGEVWRQHPQSRPGATPFYPG